MPESKDSEEGPNRRLDTNTVTLELTVNRPGGSYVTVCAVPAG